MLDSSRPISPLTPASNDSFVQSAQEKEDYASLKARIQSSFFDKKYEGCSFQTICPANKDYNPQVEAAFLREETVSHLCENLIRRGFDVRTQKKDILHSGKLISGHEVTVLLPEIDKDDSGYASDGWAPSFKASMIKKNISKAVLKSSREMDAMIKDALRKPSDPLFYKFEVDHSCPPGYKKALATQFAKELQEKGFDVSVKDFSISIVKKTD